MTAKTLDHAVAFLRQTRTAIRIAKIAGTVVGAGLIALSRWIAELDTALAASLATAALAAGIALAAFGALLLIFVDQSSPEVLEENLRLTREAEAARGELEFYKGYQDHLLARVSIASSVRELFEAALAEQDRGPDAAARLAKTLLDFFAERRGVLFGIGDEYWNFSVYVHDPSRDKLICLACRRDRAEDEEGEHRAWSPGEGHVGLAFLRQAEIIFADAARPDIKPVLAARPENLRDYDERRYVSLASIPISLDQRSPLGVLIATSDATGRFKNQAEREANEWDRADILREAASSLAIAFGLLDAFERGSNDGAQGDAEHDARPS